MANRCASCDNSSQEDWGTFCHVRKIGVLTDGEYAEDTSRCKAYTGQGKAYCNCRACHNNWADREEPEDLHCPKCSAGGFDKSGLSYHVDRCDVEESEATK